MCDPTTCSVINGYFCTGGGSGSVDLCFPHTCGDGRQTGAEACDDGNTSDGDGCSQDCATVEPTFSCTKGTKRTASTCVKVTCGDAWLGGAEQCDDGNVEPGDGCNAQCQVESGWECTRIPCSVDVNPACAGAGRDVDSCAETNPRIVCPAFSIYEPSMLAEQTSWYVNAEIPTGVPFLNVILDAELLHVKKPPHTQELTMVGTAQPEFLLSSLVVPPPPPPTLHTFTHFPITRRAPLRPPTCLLRPARWGSTSSCCSFTWR